MALQAVWPAWRTLIEKGWTIDEAYPDALPGGYRLHWYVLERVLGQGGFGITYLAHDSNLDRRVAIKEYLPSEIARRRSDATAHPRTESQSERYTWGLDRFLAEARTLARFDHPNIVRVHSVFEANNTAYMVMRFEEGESLASLLGRSGMQTERQLTHWLMPILDGLELIHEAGYIHRDIKPDNIYIRADGSPVLLDFGSARQAFGSMKTMTILVAPGYAPLEQYYGEAATQGAWTDIYGLAATCYRALAGRAPLDAVARAKGVLGSARDVMTPAVEAGRGRCTESLLAAIDQALRLSEKDRPQSVAEWRRALVAPAAQDKAPTTLVEAATGPSAAPIAAQVASAPALPSPAKTVPNAPADVAAAEKVRPLHWLWAAAAGAVGAGAVAAVALWLMPARAPDVVQAPPPKTVTRVAEPASAPLVVSPPAPAIVVAETWKESAKPARSPEPTVRTKRTVDEPAPALPKPAPGIDKSKVPPAVARVPAAAAAPSPLPEMHAETPPVAPPPAPVPTPTLTATAAVIVPPPAPPARPAGSAQIDVAEAELRRGNAASAVVIVTPWAWAGVPRAQAVLGQALAKKAGTQQIPTEAYMWLLLAERGGEADAHALSEKVAVRMQPADIRQAEASVQNWKPRSVPTSVAPP